MAHIQENIPLRDYTNYHIGGPARYFISAATLDDIAQGLSLAREYSLPYFILGGGTNVLVSDNGFEGVLIYVQRKGIFREGNSIVVGAGEKMKDVLDFCVQEKLSGLEWAGGLPGSVGGAVRGNAGAFGGEMKDSVSLVSSIRAGNGQEVSRSGAQCAFGYRDSIFKQLAAGEIIWDIRFRLLPGTEDAIKKDIDAKIAFRNANHPMEFPSAGSTFKNIPVSDFIQLPEGAPVKKDPLPVVPVAYLLDQCGLKNAQKGDACISAKHPNFIVNRGNAAANDIRALISRAKQEVKKKFGVDIAEEIHYVGKFL